MIPDHEIIFVRQTDDKDCAVACLSMACHVSYDIAKEILSLNPDGVASNSSLFQAIYALHYRPILYVPAQLEEGRLYIVAVPSLNIVGGAHYIVVDWRDKGKCLLYDPNYGRENRKVYGFDSDLISYFEVFEILIDE